MEQSQLSSGFVREAEFEITETKSGYTGTLKERGTITYYCYRGSVDAVRQDIYEYVKYNNEMGFTPIGVNELMVIKNDSRTGQVMSN